MTIAQQIMRVRAELDIGIPAEKRRLPPRSPRRVALEIRLRGLMLQQLRREIRQDRQSPRLVQA
jgi:hypothetical protein